MIDKGESFGFCDQDYDCRIIVDTGSSGIGVPRMFYDDILAILTQGKSCAGVICENAQLSDFPSLEVELMHSNSVFPLKSSDYVICTGNLKCSIRVQPSSGLDWILGDAFISVYYTLFDVQNNRVGFACNESCTGGTALLYVYDTNPCNILDTPSNKWMRLIPFIFVLVVGLYIWIL